MAFCVPLPPLFFINLLPLIANPMNIEDELLLDAQEDAQAVAYIRQHLPQELKERFSDDDLYYFLDLIVEYYAESGVLDSQPDKDGYIEIDGEAIASHLSHKAKKEKYGDFSPEDLLFVVQAQMDFEDEKSE